MSDMNPGQGQVATDTLDYVATDNRLVTQKVHAKNLQHWVGAST
jgi:hypothetical protein